MKLIKTKESLIKDLHAAASLQMSAQEVREQRVSFIMGSLKHDSTVTREQIEKVLDQQEGKK